MSPGTLRTARLDLVPMTRPLLEADLAEPTRLGEHLGASVPAGWPPGEYDRSAQEFFRERFIEQGCAELPWGNFFAVTREPSTGRTLVAAAGYHGGPDDDGNVEIGYSVVEQARGRGYATEVVLALVDHAFASPNVRRVVANTLESNPASIAVLAKCGFVRRMDGSPPQPARWERGR